MEQIKKYPKTWLQEAILLSLILPPLGLAALFYAAKVTPLFLYGNKEASHFYAHRAKRFVKIGFFFLIALVTFAILISLFALFLFKIMPRY
ncbi:hypothetical protein Bcop_1394 [Bacteroides coprosuis DSM 18011]|uniref:Interferon-induced transmembrane protein n=1 Tax=Bacteroides coprosuis DSM 18011 TaxID=679937 RepID=F3ZPD2_9BACE|nr:CD225/dispanin family protein [Bacteroides coprosuis]EGJ71589.1 hypothetical protein Bcop_1394 [Bacteroides coprosuis DSM 18011]